MSTDASARRAIASHPSILMGHGRWERVVKTLSKGTKEDQRIAEVIWRQVVEMDALAEHWRQKRDR